MARPFHGFHLWPFVQRIHDRHEETMNLIQILEQEEIARLGKKIPAFAPGDTVVVSVNVVEGERKRIKRSSSTTCNKLTWSAFFERRWRQGQGSVQARTA